MRTRSSLNLIVEPVTILKRRNRRRSKQIVKPKFRTIVENSVTTMADARTMLELLQAPTKGYGDAIVIPVILADNFEPKVKIRISRNKPIVSKGSTTTSSPSPSSDVTALIEIVKELVLMNKATQQATVKVIEETCVTCGGPHPYYECLAIGGNTFDACAAVGTYNQGGNRYRPQGDPNYHASNQMGPPVFPPTNLEECLALVDLGASINLMTLSVWKKLSLPKLTPTRMTFELANRLVAYPVGIAEDVSVNVGKFHSREAFLKDSMSINRCTRFLSTRKTKKRPPSLALMGRLPTNARLSAYVMLWARSKDKMLKRCEDTNLVINWEKCHFMVKEGIVLGHKISKSRIKFAKAKVDVIAKLPHPTSINGV
nr:reverse transcriptase domain-containing protein [Tanacetum cinerariifolium]